MEIVDKIRDLKRKVLNDVMSDDKRHELIVQLIELTAIAGKD